MNEEDHRKKLKHLSLIQDVDDFEYLSEKHERTLPEHVLREIKPYHITYETCPRCQVLSRNVVRPQYCTECGWDSLTDPCLENTATLTKGKKI